MAPRPLPSRETVLITGIDGFIGRHLGRFLRRRGCHVVGLGRARRRPRKSIDYCDTYLLFGRRGRLEDHLSLRHADHIVHLAAVTEYHRIHGHPLATLASEIRLLAALSELYAGSGARNFIYPSSGKVYGIPEYLPLDEKHPVQPTTYLGRFKRIGEMVLEYASLATGKAATVLRIFNAYGPGQKPSFLVPKLLMHSRLRKPVRVGNMREKRDYVFIDDVVRAFSTVIENPLSGFHVFNVGSGRSYSPNDLAGLIERLSGRRPLLMPDPKHIRRAEASNEVADTRALGRWGWRPETDILSGLRRTLASHLAP